MPTDHINDPTRGFNEPQELFGNNETSLDTGRKVIVRRSFFPSPDPSITGVRRDDGRVQRQIGSVSEDFAGSSVRQSEIPQIEREVFSGSIAMIRAARIIHQYDVRFWEPDGVVTYATASNQPAPDPAQAEARYNDFLAFSYLPEQMLPTPTQFNDLTHPAARGPLVVEFLRRAGLVTSPTQTGPEVPQAFDVAAEEPPLVPPPFAENLQSSCPGDDYFARSSGPVFTSDRTVAA